MEKTVNKAIAAIAIAAILITLAALAFSADAAVVRLVVFLTTSGLPGGQ